MSARSNLLEIVRAAGVMASEIPRKQGWDLLQAWREVYCAPVKAATGRWVIGGADGYSWHTFSYEYFHCLEGRRALAEYAMQPANEFLVLTERSHDMALRCYGPTLPDFSGLLRDVYVTPPMFDWTMVFTHEGEDFGPYFSRVEWASVRPSRN